ncbi:MAG: YbjN domain-containing protein [Bacteroidetes bacterium]|nr:YbjN domain-containing protein [Bacteroidota bacterium]
MSEQLAQFYFLVETGLRELEIDPSQCKGDLPGQWNLAFGDIIIGIDVWSIPEQNNKVVFQVQTALARIPEENVEAFYKELLEVNYIMYGIAFSMVDGVIYLKTMRDAHDMHHNDVVDAIRLCGFYAEHYGNQFVKDFNVQLY